MPPLSPWNRVQERLQWIFPPGTPHRNNCTWEIAARTIFVMIYIGAIEGAKVWLRPDQVTRMTDIQAARTSESERLSWSEESLRGGKGEIPGRWYAVNTRESIRDDTIRSGFVANGVVVERAGLATTSPAPRYALKKGFADLFDPALRDSNLQRRVKQWQNANLSAGALARVTLLRKGAFADDADVAVKFPNGETRRLAPGPSALITKSVIETFAPKFLKRPGVVFLSESRNKVVARDDELARAIGLHIRAERNLPDIVLVDVGPKHPLLIFCEVVATDGPITEQRKTALVEISKDGGFPSRHLAFVTAYLDRSTAAFKKTVDSIAWGSFLWFASEPEHLLRLYDGRSERVRYLSDL
ncbi:MAG TPA: BsuBI/PstI family type II restriction endonuclease [Rhizomicrobium sp.]